MIYLFNSGSKELYLDNLLKILSAPHGAPSKIRFSFKNVPKNLLDEPEKLKEYRKKECIILFVDRYHPNQYEYIPVRKGIIENLKLEGDRLVIDFYVQEYVYTDPAEFTKKILAYDNNSPSLKQGEPDNPDDGNYIQSINGENTDFEQTQDVWLKIVKDLATRKRFIDLNKVFFQLKINDSQKKAIKVKQKFKEAVIANVPTKLTKELARPARSLGITLTCTPANGHLI